MTDPIVACRFCGARIVFAKLDTGKTIPLDAEGGFAGTYWLFKDADGTVTARAVEKGARPSPDRHRVHFASCRRPRGKKR